MVDARLDRGEGAVLNLAQSVAVEHGEGPLLIVAGAGTGKTRTLVQRVVTLVERGVDPGRILLLTFTRRAAAEMLRRVESLLRRATPRSAAAATGRLWGGTFHSVASRLLRVHGASIGLEPGFTIHDRSDSEDLLDVVRADQGLGKGNRRFPRKGTCLAIYSYCVNAGRDLEGVLEEAFPWCREFVDPLRKLFAAYVDQKEANAVLDYDDLLLFWKGLLADPVAGPPVRARFEAVLVDEYQDTNRLQAGILKLLRPSGQGLTVVGDDAQSIYSFRAATVRNILDFPQEFPGTTIVTLEENYRSVQPILAATNRVIAQAGQGYAKELRSPRDGARPQLILCDDELDQSAVVIRTILAHREQGIDLRRQAVLFRTSHHSVVLEGELAQAKIPFVKYGGLRFMDTAHVKDLLAVLRLAENPRDVAAGMRVLTLLPSVGPATARRWMLALEQGGGQWTAWQGLRASLAAQGVLKQLVKLLTGLSRQPAPRVTEQVHQVRAFYAPLLEERYDHSAARLRDLEQVELLATRFDERATFLAEIALDPPSSTEDFAGDPLLDEDYLILSTIHSAKGLEWDAVYVIHAADGNIPSDMATKNQDQIDEERRLFYVALTRARDWLTVYCPLRYYQFARGPKADRHGMAQLTRFLPAQVLKHFDCVASHVSVADGPAVPAPHAGGANRRQQIRDQSRVV